MEIIDVPTAVRNKLIKMAPKNIERLKLDKWIAKKEKKEIKLWGHQIEAIKKWLENNKKCIFEMATATGKTFAALGCLKELLKEEKKLITIIACPYNHLVIQWKANLDKFGINIDSIVADTSNPKWKHQLIDYVRDINNDVKEKLMIFTTHDTFYTQDFIDIIRISRNKLFLIGDEVHGMWSEERKKGFIDLYEFRLGLSATPSRWFDPEGTVELLSYFNIKDDRDKFIFPLEKAIKTVNPDTGKTYLTPYEYKPYFVELTEEELENYEQQTKKIARVYHSSRSKEERRKFFNLLCIKRQEIIKNAANKYNVFENILEIIGEIKHCLIYCSPEQIGPVQDILNEKFIVQHKFTQDEGTSPEIRYGGISEREYLLKNFAEGIYQALVAMRCLDEGVDMPQARIGIILASAGNPRQYIQRRGRILRRFPGKEKAFIYDLIVLPCLARGISDELIDLERKIATKEFKRYEEFAKIALNALECIKKVQDVERKLNLYG